ncbi:MAG: VWA domain-containing protein [Treponema sp.]|jgi:hypothetical protein|nr:VWA domain-containing protein [Treponema sp.]
MRKQTLALALLLGAVFWSHGQTRSASDLILLLDTSISMSSSYQELRDYITGPFLREFLHIGDTFHLISFSDTPRREISSRVTGVGNVETIIARLFLMYPLDPHANLSSALSFVERYISSLPSARTKHVVLITGLEEGESSIAQTAARLSRSRTTVQVIRFPFPGSGPVFGFPTPDATAQAETAQPKTAQVETAQPGTVQPETAQAETAQPETAQAETAQPKTAQAETAQPETAQAETAQAETAQAETAQAETAQAEAAQAGRVESPPEVEAVETTAPLSRGTPAETAPPISEPPLESAAEENAQADSPPPAPEKQAWKQSIENLIQAGIGKITDLSALIAAQWREFPKPKLWPQNAPRPAGAAGTVFPAFLLTILGVTMMASLTFVLLRAGLKLQHSSNRTLAWAAEAPSRDGVLMLSLFVQDQNTAIGRRNTHTIKPGYRYTIGGGKSDYLIFLVPVPPRIAEIYYDGRYCTFSPKKPHFFPELGAAPLSNCVGKAIKVVSEKNHEFIIRLERREDPLRSLNALACSVGS